MNKLEQEPVDVARVQVDGSVEWRPDLPDLPVGTKLYTSPPRTREWVGLTDNEVSYCWIGKEVSGTAFDIYFFARAIEAKLKEKNT
jgi:hypothetical protein